MQNHQSVLLKEVIKYLNPEEGDLVMDATFGFGGHSKEISDLIGGYGKIIAFEQDPRVCKLSSKDLPGNIELINDNFINYREHFDKLGIKKIDKVLFDLGVSSWHFDQSKVGFSFKKNEPLDMRLNPQSKFSAKDVVNKYTERELADVFFYLSDEREARKIAKAIVSHRSEHKIISTEELVQIIKQAKRKRGGRIHPATKVFQALRIEVNKELSNLRDTLEGVLKDIKVDGRVVVISFHSKEDKIVKEFFKKMHREGVVQILTKKPIIPSPEEITKNPRSRSAKMRAVIRRK